MFRTIAFLSRKPGITLEQFRRHYEDHHVPLVLSLAARPLVYERRYIDRDGPRPSSATPVDFDVVTEIVFASEADFRSGLLEPLVESPQAYRIADDEATFLDRLKTTSYSFIQSE